MNNNEQLKKNNYLVDMIHEQQNLLTCLFKKNKNSTYTIIYTNKAATNFWGEAHIKNNTFSEELLSQLLPLFANIKDEQQNVNSNYVLLLNDKQYTFDISIVAINEEKDIYGMMMYDKTNQLPINNSSEITDKYFSLIENNIDTVLIIDQVGIIQYANKIILKVFGYEEKTLLHQPIEQYISEESLRNFQLIIKQTMSGYSTEMQNCLIQHEKGHFISTYLKAIPIISGGTVKGLHLVLRNTISDSEEQDQLFYLVYHDHLTGLWNRRALKEHLSENIKQASKTNSEISIIRIDLDRFKLINESLGYTSGDELLKKIADRLSLYIDKSSNLYRQSGDEFVFLLKGKTKDETSQFAESILTELAKPIYLDHQEYFGTASIGISMFPYDGQKQDELLLKADQALYVAKDRGRAHYRYFQEQMNLSFPNEALMESHLRRAIEKEELSIHYQPQVNLLTGEINSFEALLRWNNRKFGYVSPMHFIPIAEKSGIIFKLGDWVLEEVCSQLKLWQDKGYRMVRIAMNISPQQFKQDNFASKIREKINKYNLLPSSLEVEITESAMTDLQDTFTILKELKDIGVVISIDDFGTGYSSLSYLRKYPIDIIKIDQSFIKDMETDEKSAAIATTIIRLAHSLGMEVIAEGVEKDTQVEILKAANCQKAQGFFFSRPVPIEDINKSYMNYY
ncbi:EAL domain-containing protein [Psychrobacillus sp. FSL K6-2684]|uniref:EAL domain-containing protein n=1 Tax=Psychrobacillus sp. FSL K6-2684 TaxID=2921547 RepID=UPI0030F88063